MILLDTHALVWMDADDGKLGRAARRAIDAQWEAQQVGVSAVSFWECAMLCAKGRLELPHATRNWRADLLAAGLIEFPVDGEIAVLAAELDALHGDLADRFIAATAIVRGATLLTADERLLAWKHRVKRQDARK